VILVSLLFLALATFLMIAHPSIYTLFVTRIFQGIGVGLIQELEQHIYHPDADNAAQVAAYVSLNTALGFSSGALFTNVALSSTFIGSV
jgi:MFS family permease